MNIRYPIYEGVYRILTYVLILFYGLDEWLIKIVYAVSTGRELFYSSFSAPFSVFLPGL